MWSTMASEFRNECCKNKIKGTAINPENDTAFPIAEISLITKVFVVIKN